MSIDSGSINSFTNDGSDSDGSNDSDPFGDCKERPEVYRRVTQSIADMAHTPFDKLPMGEQCRWNDYADTLISLSLSYMRRDGEREGYKRCGDILHQTAYAVCLKYGARWERVERIAWFLSEMDHYRKYQRYGATPPDFPFKDRYKEG